MILHMILDVLFVAGFALVVLFAFWRPFRQALAILAVFLGLTGCAVAQRTTKLSVYDPSVVPNRVRAEIDGTLGLTITDYSGANDRTALHTGSYSLYAYTGQTKIAIQPGNLTGTPTIQMLGWDAGASVYRQTLFEPGVNQTRDMSINGDKVQSVILESISASGGDDYGIQIRHAPVGAPGIACNNRAVRWDVNFQQAASSQTGMTAIVYPCTTTDVRNSFYTMGGIFPLTTATWQLGSSSLRWTDVVSSTLTGVGGSVRLTSTGGGLLANLAITGGGDGSANFYTSGGSIHSFIDASGVSGQALKVAGTTVVSFSLAATFSQLTVNGTSFLHDIVPSAASTYGLGTAGAPWRYLYMEGANNNISCGGSCGPTIDGNDFWGTSSNRWAGLYTYGLNIATAGAGGSITVGGNAGITHTTTHACVGTQVFTMGVLTATTGTC